jgi:hypothetical protein
VIYYKRRLRQAGLKRHIESLYGAAVSRLSSLSCLQNLFSRI